MAYENRKPILSKIESLRRGRLAVVFANFDRISIPPMPGLQMQFQADVKEALFRVLKESSSEKHNGVDIFLYTRGGDTNSVWPIVSLLREFDPDFEVLTPFRCHSAGTLLALASRRIVMSPIAELSPIDPSTGNQFNPSDPSKPNQRLGISVEDVTAYRSFICSQFGLTEGRARAGRRELMSVLQPAVLSLVERVHPLALGNVHRVHQQIKFLAKKLLEFHPRKQKIDDIIESLTTQFFSHLHMISREEAQAILGREQVVYATKELAEAMDELLRTYEDDFALRRTFFLHTYMEDKPEEEVRFIGGIVESKTWSYVLETRAKVRQQSAVPANVQIQIPAGQPMPLIPGLPRESSYEVINQGWVRNKEPRGVTK